MNKKQREYFEKLKEYLPPPYNLFINGIDNYDERKIGRSEIDGLIVSTCLTYDMGYETAILDKNNAYPVERYKDKDDAAIGHYEWCIKSKTLEYVDVLGWIQGEGSKTNHKLERIIKK